MVQCMIVFVNYKVPWSKRLLSPEKKVYALIKFKLLKISNSLVMIAFDGTKEKGEKEGKEII